MKTPRTKFPKFVSFDTEGEHRHEFHDGKKSASFRNGDCAQFPIFKLVRVKIKATFKVKEVKP